MHVIYVQLAGLLNAACGIFLEIFRSQQPIFKESFLLKTGGTAGGVIGIILILVGMWGIIGTLAEKWPLIFLVRENQLIHAWKLIKARVHA